MTFAAIPNKGLCLFCVQDAESSKPASSASWGSRFTSMMLQGVQMAHLESVLGAAVQSATPLSPPATTAPVLAAASGSLPQVNRPDCDTVSSTPVLCRVTPVVPKAWGDLHSCDIWGTYICDMCGTYIHVTCVEHCIYFIHYLIQLMPCCLQLMVQGHTMVSCHHRVSIEVT